ncbi:unnamed protein product (macronuclear) [Paramecium tetraurelia]|uniref:Uncharacterized protein n=1 Tax=Paramecium tetraurelia TaxID=5888 RepID=A0DYK1_PARTE|nr:uncharacterized protein GSPATT00003086001 [Paramecium tetraurelia]CAK88118.1 unnamed protein product [Paramecium tetraurelia]|eukprot:XP_001455515.1 hypothetical protein (macronuclear) [Paramecium tetraurelia strain d4-2]
MSQKDAIEQQKEDLNVEKENENDDKTDIQQNQSFQNETNQDNSRIQAPSIELRNSQQEENQEQAYLPKEVSNVATPTRTSQIDTSPVGKIDRQSLDGTEQKQDEQIEQNKELINEQEIVGTQINQHEHHEDTDQKQSEKDQNEQNHQNEQEELQKSFHSFQKSQKSGKSTTLEKITILQSALQMKDELILTMQDEIQVLKQSQLDKQQHIETMEKIYEEKLEKLFKKVGQLEKLLKEKENDIEQFRNGNQTLHLQDLSVISQQKNENLKSNANDKKDVTIFEVLNEKQTTADLSELGNNFWLISAERKIQKSNPLYKDYFPKDPEPDQTKNKIIINHPTKKYDKSYWFKYVDVQKPSRQNHNIQLPKLPEANHQQQHNDPTILSKQFQQQQEIQQKIIQSIQEQSYGYSQIQQNKVNPVQQSIPFSQKLLANNQRSSSQQQKQFKNKLYASQPNIAKEKQVSFDQEEFLADQEIEKMFAQQSPPKKQKIDWDSQPQNNYMIVQHTNSSQVIEQKEKFPILSQKLSYVNQYSHKKEMYESQIYKQLKIN